MRTNQKIYGCYMKIHYTKIHDDGLTYFGSNEGLNTKNINSFTEFEIGNYWVSTTNGLFKFDGNNFTNYSLKEGL